MRICTAGGWVRAAFGRALSTLCWGHSGCGATTVRGTRWPPGGLPAPSRRDRCRAFGCRPGWPTLERACAPPAAPLVSTWGRIYSASFGPASGNSVKGRLHARQRYLPHLPDGRHVGPAAFPDSGGEVACLRRPVDFGDGDGVGLRDAAG